MLSPMRPGFLAFALLLFAPLRVPATDPVPFADVQFRLLAVGEHQQPQEVGSFQASLPIGTPGRLQRVVTIANQTRGTGQKLALDMTLTPIFGEDQTLHCMVLSDATPEEGKPVSRAKDLVFTHPGDQLMELFADAPTGIHLVLALQAALPDQEGSSGPPKWRPIRFVVKVERWNGAERTIVDKIQLTSEDGAAVSHRYEQRIPRWVEPEEAGTAGPADNLVKLRAIDPKTDKTPINTREGFSISLKPEGNAPATSSAEAPATGKNLIWVQEWVELSIVPVEIKDGAVSFQIAVSGEAFDLGKGQSDPLGRIETSRTAHPMEPAPLYLTREQPGGPRGFVIWVVPEW
jgi:hypothetical protein